MRVYLITNTRNGKQYVGLTTGPVGRRFREHLSESRRRPNTPLHRALRKYGAASFDFAEIACAVDLGGLKLLEIHLIEQYGAHVSHGGYNVSRGGDGSVGVTRSAQWRARISAANKGRKHSAEVRARMSAAKKAQGLSAECLAKMQAARKLAPPSIRSPLSEATKAKLSASLKRRGCWRPAIEAYSRAAAERMAVRCGPDHRAGSNLYVDPNGRHHCRACNQRAHAKRKLKAGIAA